MKILQYSLSTLVRKAVFVFIRQVRNVRELIRIARFYFLTHCRARHIMGRVEVNTLCTNMKMGKNASLYANTVFEVAQLANLTIGDNFTLSYGAIIACNHSVQIGNNVMIGEYSSIRDTTHNYKDLSLPYCQQPDLSEAIIIGNNVWIGRGTIVFPGSVIEDGVIVGAHSVVKGRLTANQVYAGSPLKMIKELGAPASAQ